MEVCGPIHKNAKRLEHDAHCLIELQSYASAAALLVLSLEETVKSMLVFLHAHGYAIYSIKEAKMFFRDHRIRHRVVRFVELGIVVAKLQRDSIVNDFETLLSKICALGVELENIQNKVEKFNLLKNQGFYADYTDRLILPNEVVTQGEVTALCHFLKRAHKFCQFLRILHHPRFRLRRPEQKVSELQGLLATVIYFAKEKQFEPNEKYLRDAIDSCIKERKKISSFNE